MTSLTKSFSTARAGYERNGHNLKDVTLRREEMDFSYRCSRIKREGGFLIRASLTLVPTPLREHLSRRRSFLARRRAEQPTEYPSLGSVFLACDGIGAGYYIDRAGLKGVRVGNAEISGKHAGFIVNLGGATAEDVRSLIKIAKKEVFSRFGIALTEEIVYL